MRVDIITPASSASREELQWSLKFLKSLDLKPSFKGGFSKNSFFAQEDKLSAKIFQESLQNQETKIIWSLRGGYGSQRLLCFLKKRPQRSKKIFIGSSDVTVLHDWIHHHLNWPSLHFPVMSKLKQTSSLSHQKFKNLIQKKIKFVEFSGLKLLNKKKNFKDIISKITGGNLTLIQTSIGTPWNFSRKNKILFLEDVNQKPYTLHRALWQMKWSGVFKGVRAVIFGEFDLMTQKRVIQVFAQQCSFPVLYGLKCGHGRVSDPLPLGTRAELKVHQGKLKVFSPFGVE